MLFRRYMEHLMPMDEEANAYVRSLAPGSDVVLKSVYKRPRSVRQHRLFFAMLNKVFENQAHYPTLDALRHELLIKLGRIDSYHSKDGSLRIIPQSISFGNMSQEEFQKLMDDARDFLLQEVVPHWEPDALDEFLDMVA